MAPGPDIVRKTIERGTTIWAPQEYIDALVEAGIASPQAFIKKHASSIIDDITKSKITSISLNMGGKAFRIAAKEYLPRGGRHFLKNIFRPSKARVELILSSRLKNLGVNVPEPLAAVEIRSARTLNKSYLFSEEIVDGTSLLGLLDAREHINLPRLQINRVIEIIARTIAHAHNKGFCHNDLNASHIIIKDLKTDKPLAYLVDFENSRIRKSIDMKERIKDLGRLERSAAYFLSVGDRLRFMKKYRIFADQNKNLRDWIYSVQDVIARRSR